MNNPCSSAALWRSTFTWMLNFRSFDQGDTSSHTWLGRSCVQMPKFLRANEQFLSYLYLFDFSPLGAFSNRNYLYSNVEIPISWWTVLIVSCLTTCLLLSALFNICPCSIDNWRKTLLAVENSDTFWQQVKMWHLISVPRKFYFKCCINAMPMGAK